MPRSGSLINNRYQLDEPLASGGMGQIWRATDQTLGRTVAVKFLRPRHLDDDGSVQFLGEARAMAALLHPGVAAVYDYGQTRLDDGVAVAYLVMAWVAGQSLEDRIAEAGRLGAAETASIVAQAGRALQAVHDSGVVHRDVKPANLMVEPDGRVVLVDFGVAVSTAGPGPEKAGEVVGTALYLAPEQAARLPISPATDVYALGAVAYHCLAGHPPFLGDSPIAVAMRHIQEQPPPLPDDVPATLRRLVATAMAKDPTRRFATAAAMADAAEAAIDVDHRATAGSTRPTADVLSVDPPPLRSDRRRRRTSIIATLLGCAAALLAAWAFADPADLVGPPTERPTAPATTTTPPIVGTSAPGGGTGGEQVTNPPGPGQRGPGGGTGDVPGVSVSPSFGFVGQPPPVAGGNGGQTPGPTPPPTTEPSLSPTPAETSPEPEPSPDDSEAPPASEPAEPISDASTDASELH